MGLGKITDEPANLVNEILVDIGHQSADARETRVEPLPRGHLEDIVKRLTLIEGVKECSESTKIEGGCADAQQVITDPGQLVQDGADVLAPGRDLDPHQLLDRVMPGG